MKGKNLSDSFLFYISHIFILLTTIFIINGCGQQDLVNNQPIATLIQPPTTIEAVISSMQVELGWSSVTDASSYNIYWSNSSDLSKTNATKISGLTDLFYTHSDLKNGTTYYYAISTTDKSNNESSLSTIMAATPETKGALDLSFGNNGVSIYSTVSEGNSLAISSDGKILITGGSGVSGTDGMTIWKYNTNGSTDTSFGTSGKVVSDAGYTIDYGYDITTSSYDELFVAGASEISLGNFAMAIWKYDLNGNPSPYFGNSGKITYESSNFDRGTAIALDSNDRILVAGYSQQDSKSYLTLWRYTSDSILDTSFGTSGKVLYTGENGTDYAKSVKIDSNNRILVGGYTLNSAGNLDALVLRYFSDGTLDTSFGINGRIAFEGGIDKNDIANAITIDLSGKIIVTGSSVNASGNRDLFVLKYNSDGSSDASFGDNGKVIYAGEANNDDVGNSVVADASGKIVVCGASQNSSLNYDLLILRYNTDGSLDSSFGASGKAYYDSGDSSDDIGNCIKLDSSGRFVIVGKSFSKMTVWRYK